MTAMTIVHLIKTTSYIFGCSHKSHSHRIFEYYNHNGSYLLPLQHYIYNKKYNILLSY
jgi:hypothetical protein